jgi:hypothetical protein
MILAFDFNLLALVLIYLVILVNILKLQVEKSGIFFLTHLSLMDQEITLLKILWFLQSMF